MSVVHARTKEKNTVGALVMVTRRGRPDSDMENLNNAGLDIELLLMLTSCAETLTELVPERLQRPRICIVCGSFWTTCQCVRRFVVDLSYSSLTDFYLDSAQISKFVGVWIARNW
jgi:hypothetical protein